MNQAINIDGIVYVIKSVSPAYRTDMENIQAFNINMDISNTTTENFIADKLSFKVFNIQGNNMLELAAYREAQAKLQSTTAGQSQYQPHQIIAPQALISKQLEYLCDGNGEYILEFIDDTQNKIYKCSVQINGYQ